LCAEPAGVFANVEEEGVWVLEHEPANIQGLKEEGRERKRGRRELRPVAIAWGKKVTESRGLRKALFLPCPPAPHTCAMRAPMPQDKSESMIVEAVFHSCSMFRT